MKVCLIPVCYNAHEDASRFLDSVDRAFEACPDFKLELILADNSTIDSNIDLAAHRAEYTYRYLKNDNIGYFPAFSRALSELSEGAGFYDFVVVCNVDLVIAADFFSTLKAHQVALSTGLIAPGIFSVKDGRDLNPKMLRRPTAFKINFMRFVCSNVSLFRWYHKLVRMREQARSRKQRRGSEEGISAIPVGSMYGAHGSFMIFTSHYFEQGASVDYPRFLFGEEGFVAEQLRSHGLNIEHVKQLRIYDKEHASTSKVKLDFICAEHRKSYDYFYTNFLKNRS